mgnify:CR=1 FL=1|jgi:proteasome lid subunit RPN8/RPN11
MIKIDARLIRDLLSYCRSKLPEEACGALVGKEANGIIRVTGVVPIANRSPAPLSRFRFDAEQWIKLLYGSARSGETVVGVFHSHPTVPAVPSAEDLATHWRVVPSHWIVSFADPTRPEVAAYRYEPETAGRGCNVRYEPIRIECC